MSVANSQEGAAIFDISDIGPGMAGAGEVAIGNTGAAPATLSLASFDPSDAPGPYGGSLSSQIDLRIDDVTSGPAENVYAGGLASMPELHLGTVAAGHSRTYSFSVTMRDSGTPSTPYGDDNRYQRAQTRLSYEWTLIERVDDPAGPTKQLPASAPPAGITLPSAAGAGQRATFGDDRPNLLVGTPADDLIYGLGAADTIYGRGGDDYVFGGAGADRVYGGYGDDRLRGGVGPDRIVGGPGADVIFARDGEPDRINCGSGRDTAVVDEYDVGPGCESIIRGYGRLFREEQARTRNRPAEE